MSMPSEVRFPRRRLNILIILLSLVDGVEKLDRSTDRQQMPFVDQIRFSALAKRKKQTPFIDVFLEGMSH